jgi:short-subunit dehydrogenase
MSGLAGARVLLTGATGGLGRAIAAALHQRGAHLVLSGRRGDVLQELASQLDAEAVIADLADADAVDRLTADPGRLDVFIANAGIPASGELDSFDADEIDRALAVNLRAPIAITRALLPAWKTRRSGHLCFVSSLGGKAAPPGASVYSATKFGLRGFAGSLRADLVGSGIGVSTVFPGFVRDAGMFHDARAKLPPGVGTVTPEAVAAGVIRALTSGRAEVDVASMPLRLGTLMAALAPGLAGAVQARVGRRAAAAIAQGQLVKR